MCLIIIHVIYMYLVIMYNCHEFTIVSYRSNNECDVLGMFILLIFFFFSVMLLIVMIS